MFVAKIMNRLNFDRHIYEKLLCKLSQSGPDQGSFNQRQGL